MRIWFRICSHGYSNSNIQFTHAGHQQAQVFAFGQVTLLHAGLFSDEEKHKLLEDARGSLVLQGTPDSPALLWKAFIERVRCQLHIVLCMSPMGESFRLRLRRLPALVNCCTINWFSDWPPDALQ